MRRFVLAFGLMLAALGALAQDALQVSFVQGMRLLEGGRAAEAEDVFRAMLERTDSPRVKLELARALYAQGKLGEAKTQFKQVAAAPDTPWRVRDNIERYVADIEARTGYLKFGVTIISDSNPRNLAPQEEFAIGNLRVTPTEAPKEEYGLRYLLRGWRPVSEDGRTALYLSTSYNDFEGEEIDRATIDAGLVQALTESGRVRGKAGLEAGTFGGHRLYTFPYLGLDAVLLERPAWRLAGEMKLGKVDFDRYAYLDADFASAALSARRSLSPTSSATLRFGVEHSHAAEKPYSYAGWDFSPGLNVLWTSTAFTLAASALYGERKYGAPDPLFGARREDARSRVELTIGNKEWRWGGWQFAVVAAYEENRSSIGFYDYRKTSVSIVAD